MSTPSTATAANAIKVAASQNGQQENPDGSNVCKFSTWFGVTGPWCAMFLSWCWWAIGLRFTRAQTERGWASAESMRCYFRNKGWLVTTPRAGDVVFWHFPNGHAGANHVSLFVSGTADTVTTWDGNTSTANDRDGGHVEKRTRPKGNVIGYGRPPYAAGTATTKAPTWWTRTQLLTSPMRRGADIAAAATRLGAKGFPCGSPANVFGPQMDKSVRAFQKAAGLKVDGQLGPTTATALGA
jgi:hypothetical protein